jgi:hypothetical protein
MSRAITFGIVGGYGATGRAVASELWKSCDAEILIGGRDSAKGKVLAAEFNSRVSAGHLKDAGWPWPFRSFTKSGATTGSTDLRWPPSPEWFRRVKASRLASTSWLMRWIQFPSWQSSERLESSRPRTARPLNERHGLPATGTVHTVN